MGRGDAIGFIVILILIFALFSTYALYERVTTGCFFPQQETFKFDLIDDYNYTCPQLEKMITLQAYPDLNATVYRDYCEKSEGNYTERRYVSSMKTGLVFSNWDFKETYVNGCLKQ